MRLMICSAAKRCGLAEDCPHGKPHEPTEWCDKPCLFAERGKASTCRQVTRRGMRR
jgi:hypothetical protein